MLDAIIRIRTHSVAEIQVGRGGGATAPLPSVNRHSLSEIFGSVGIFKTIEYT